MEKKFPSKTDIEQHLARLAPPTIPAKVWTRNNVNIFAVKTWKLNYCVSVLAGLLTEPALYANNIRLDWLQRIVFAKSNGHRKPKPNELARALNLGLGKARVNLLEDPIEDLFCDLIVSRKGNFHIFTGNWETPGPYTQTLLDAFEALPPAPQKDAALKSVFSILRLSDELAQRANVHRFSQSDGDPKAVINIPGADTLQQYATRVQFSNNDLSDLGIDRQRLSPFFLTPNHFSHIGSNEPGESPLELYPLLPNSKGITVASPAGISLAIRAMLVEVAKRGGLKDLLLLNLMKEQERYSEETGFWPMFRIRLAAPDQHFLRSSVLQSSEGRFLQIIQVPVTFDQFPQKAFASVRRMSNEVNRSLADKVSLFWDLVRQKPHVRDCTTVLLLSGFGTPHVIEPPIDQDKAPPGWRFMAMTSADVATLGACENGNFSEIRRVLDQVELLEDDGFSFKNPNGLLNLFGFWRRTNGHLIPEHEHEIEPPCTLILPTDDLLEPRIEAATKRGYFALPCMNGSFKKVLLVDRDNLPSIYASPTDLDQGRLIGAAWIERRVWWIESLDNGNVSREERYRLWDAVLQWLIAVGSAVIQQFPTKFPEGPSAVSVNTPSVEAYEILKTQRSVLKDIKASVSISRAHGTPEITLTPDWLAYVRDPENIAEVELVAAVLEALQVPLHNMASRDDLRNVIRKAINSTDWRWMHVQEAFTPLERLAGSGLLEDFKEIPFSSFSLGKCGAIWKFRDRSEGTEVKGEENCRIFLAQYRKHILNYLISGIQRFNRDKLALSAAACYQSARYEESRWRFTIRAMRAIHGADADQKAVQKQNAINAVLRAAKSILEIAACEASRTTELVADQFDLENLFAIALLLFSNGQLFASIRAGLIQPTLRISPAGDLLSDRSTLESVLMPTMRLATMKILNESDDAYGRTRPSQNQPSDGKLLIDDAFRAAIEAEYKVTAEEFVDLQYAILQIAERRKSGVFLMKGSELARELEENKYYKYPVSAAMLDRLTLSSRNGWGDLSSGLKEGDLDLGRFDRPHSLINRPLLALETMEDPLLLISTILVSDSTMYALSGLRDGNLQNQFWTSSEAKSYVGKRSEEAGLAFEERVAEKLRSLGLRAWTRVKLSWILNRKVDPIFGDIDVLAVSRDNQRIWVLEAKDLRFCRTEAEVSARLSEYRGRIVTDAKGRQRPDKMFRHIRRVQYLRAHNEAICSRLELNATPEVHGLLVVDSPQPMNFYMLDQLEDGQSAFLESIHEDDF
jgi:hypothetical protein